MSDLVYQFTGVVESIEDKEEMNRVKVRIFGKHEDSTELDPSTAKGIPWEDLPWAYVAMPTTGAGMHGLGQSPHGLLEGSWVWGISRDGPLYNDLLVLAVIATKAPGKENPNPLKPDRPTPAQEEPDSPPLEAFWGKDGQWPDKEFTGESDISRLARGVLAWRDQYGLDPKTWVGWDASGTEAASAGSPYKVHGKGHGRPEWDFAPIPGIKNAEKVKWIPLIHPHDPKPSKIPFWNELSSPFGAKYPHNKVLFEGASRTTIEVDETPGAERIAEFHGPSHTYREVHPDGSVQTKIYGSNYTIVLEDNNVWIQGSTNVTVTGDINIYSTGGDVNIHSEKGDFKILTKEGDIEALAAKGDIKAVAEKGDIKVEAEKGGIDIKSLKPINMTSKTRIKLSAPRIDVN